MELIITNHGVLSSSVIKTCKRARKTNGAENGEPIFRHVARSENLGGGELYVGPKILWGEQ